MGLLTILAAAAVGLAPNSTLYSDGRPPTAFQRDAVTVVEFASASKVQVTCEAQFGKAPAGMRTRACATGAKLVMPNPCTYPAQDGYAQLLCHELGHVNGWPPTHGDAQASPVVRTQGVSTDQTTGGRS